MDNDKLRMHTPDIMEENFKKLQALFPSAVTETLDAGGKLRRAVDADVLRQLIDACIAEGRDERYQFTWPEKAQSVLRACAPTRKTLRLNRAKSVGRDGTAGSIDTENIYIEGDNLEALKILQETYLGKVKMIYIDPPYNTGNDFIYRDDFSEDEDEYWEESGQLDEEGGRLVQNMESSGRFHTNWLNMIYPRLWLARDLLSDDGVIFISIDDNEAHNLRKCCDDVFGAGNFICQFIWEKTQHFGRQKLNSYCNNDYVLCYTRRLFAGKMKELLVESIKTELLDAPLYNASNNIKTLEFPVGSTKFNLADGVYSTSESKDYELLNPVIVENGKNKNAFSLRFRSRWSNATVQSEIKKGTTFWVKTASFAIRAIYGDNMHSTEAPRQIIFTNTRNPMATKSRFNDRIDTSENATNQLKALMGGAYFSYPKPVSLIKYFISLLYNEEISDYEKDFLVLDFFSGSATTAHAVMQLNAEDGGHRRFIMIQLPEECAEGTEARKAGFANICEIGEERIRRAGNQTYELSLESLEKEGIIEKCALDAETYAAAGVVPSSALAVLRRFGYKACDELIADAQSPEAASKLSVLNSKLSLDTGFRVFYVDSSNMKDVWYTPEETEQEGLGELVDNIKEDRTAEDLLFQAMLELGIELSADIAEEEIAGHRVFYVRGKSKDLAACFDSNIKEETLTEIARRQPAFAVFRDSGMPDDSAYVNFEQIFKGYSPRTVRRVI